MNSLILSGGGGKGCFEAGALYEIFDYINFEYIHGTSVGALNSLVLAQCYINNSKELFKEIWLNEIQKNKHVFKRNWGTLIGRPPFNFSPLRKIIDKYIESDKVIKMDKIFKFTAVDLISGKSVVMNNQTCKDKKTLINSVIASASIPPGFKPVEIGEHKLIDGGTRDNIPIKGVLKNDKIKYALVILCNPKEIEKEEGDYKNVFSIGLRAIDIMTHEIKINYLNTIMRINDLIETIKETEKEKNAWLASKKIIDIDVIEPEGPIGGVLNFNHETMVKSFDLGRKQGKKYLKSVDLNFH